MSINAINGPNVTFGITLSSSGAVADGNSQRGPDLSDLGYGFMDPRPAYHYQPGSGVTAKVFGFGNNRAMVDYVPATISASAFAVSSATVPVSGTALTLTPSSALGTYTTTIIAPETGQAVSVIAIDSTAAYLTFGSDGTVACWNPAAGTGRCISISASSSGDGGSWSIAGRDMYGFKMTETVPTSTAAGAATIKSKKAFKYISSITASTTITSTGVGIGLSDTYGMPLKLSYCGIDTVVQLLASAYSSAVAVALSSANISLASTAATQTSTCPDVRGTYASTTASNGTLRLQIAQTPTINTFNSVTATDVSALFGGTQFSSV